MLRALIDFTLSNARRFYSSMGNPLDGKGLSDLFSNVCENNPYKSKLRNMEYNVVLDHVPKTEYYKGSFSYRGGMLWNSLPNDIKSAESKAIFKRKLASRQANC